MRDAIRSQMLNALVLLPLDWHWADGEWNVLTEKRGTSHCPFISCANPQTRELVVRRKKKQLEN